LKNPFTRAHLEFLSYNLGRFCSLNTLFQSELPLLHCLQDEIHALINSFKMDIISVENVRASTPMDELNDDDLLPLEQIYLGPLAMDSVASIEENLVAENEDIRSFKRNCQA